MATTNDPIAKLQAAKERLQAKQNQQPATAQPQSTEKANPLTKYYTPKSASATTPQAGSPVPLVTPQAANPAPIKQVQQVQQPKPKVEKPWYEDVLDGIEPAWENVKAMGAKGIAEAADLLTGFSPSAGGFSTYGRIKKAEFKGEDIGPGAELRSYGKDREAEAEELNKTRDTDSFGYKVGSVIPYTAGILAAVATKPVSAPLAAGVGLANVAGLSAVSFGSGLDAYDKYKEEKGQEKDPLARIGVGALYGGLEFGMERLSLSKFLPKGVKSQLSKKVLDSMGGEAVEKTAKDLITDFANSNESRKKLVETVTKEIGKGIKVEGSTEAATTLGQEFSNYLFQEREDWKSPLQILQESGEAFVLGGIMGGAIGPVSYGAQRIENQQRRTKAEKLVFAQVKGKNEAVEIIGVTGSKPKQGEKKLESGTVSGTIGEERIYQAIKPDGRVIEISENELGQTFQVKPETFNELLKGKAKGEQILTEKKQSDAQQAAAQQQQELAGQFSQFSYTGMDGIPMISQAKFNDEEVFVTAMLPDGSAVIIREDGEKKVIKQDGLTDINTTPLDQFVQTMAPTPAPILSNPANPIQRGEEVNLEGQTYVVTGFDLDSGIVQLENTEDGSDLIPLDITLFESLRTPQVENPTEVAQPDLEEGPAKLRELFAEGETVDLGGTAAKEETQEDSKLPKATPETTQQYQEISDLVAKKLGTQFDFAPIGLQKEIRVPMMKEFLSQNAGEIGAELADIIEFPKAALRFLNSLPDAATQPDPTGAIEPQSPSIPTQPASQEQAGVEQPTPENAPAQPVGEGVDPTIPVTTTLNQPTTTTNEIRQTEPQSETGQEDVQAPQNQENRSQEGEGQEGLEGPVLNQDEDITQANSAEQLAELYEAEVQNMEGVNPKDSAIANHIGKVNPDSFARFGDRNTITQGMAGNWIAQKGSGKQIDLIAQEASQEFNGTDDAITPEDVVNFLNTYSSADQLTQPSGNPRLKAIADKYKELTGKGINRKTKSTQTKIRQAEQEVSNLKAQYRSEKDMVEKAKVKSKLDKAEKKLKTLQKPSGKSVMKDEAGALLETDAQIADYLSKNPEIMELLSFGFTKDGQIDYAQALDMLDSDPDWYTVFPGGFSDSELPAIRTIIQSKLNEKQGNQGANQPVSPSAETPSGDQPIANQPKAQRKPNQVGSGNELGGDGQKPNPNDPIEGAKPVTGGNEGAGSDLTDGDLKKKSSKFKEVNGYKITNTPSFDDAVIDLFSEFDYSIDSIRANKDRWNKALLQGVKPLGNGWYEVSKDVSRGETAIYAPSTNEGVVISGKKGGGSAVLISDFINNNPRTEWTPTKQDSKPKEDSRKPKLKDVLSGKKPEGPASKLSSDPDAPRFSIPAKTKNLVVLHNIRAKGIMNAIKLGGLPVPSLAITSVDNEFSSYGEITLIADKSLIDPSDSDNKVYNADIYSPRYPSITYEPNVKSLQKVFDPISTEVIPAFRNIVSVYEVENKIGDRGADGLRDSSTAKAAFMKEKTGSLPEPKEVMSQDVSPEMVEHIRAKKAEGQYDALEARQDDEFIDLYRQQYIKKLQNSGYSPESVNDLSSRITKDNLKYSFSDVFWEAERMVSGKKKYDEYAFKEALNKYVVENQEEFNDWVDQTFNKLKVEEKIFKGYTPSGSRRYSPHNLENVVKILTTRVQNGENFNYGAGNIRAGAAKRFRSLNEIANNRDKIISREEFESIKETTQNGLFELMDLLKPNYKYDASGFGYYDNAAEALAEHAQGKRGALTEVFKNLSSDQIKSINEYLMMLETLPTEYFEAKPQRALELSEFVGAVVPNDTKPNVIQELKDRGLQVYTYDEKKDSDRKRAVQEATQELDVRFMRQPSNPQTETKAFKEWFGDSKVVDENGKPLVVYHATQSDFDSFDKKKAGSAIDFGTLGEGFYFTTDPENASNYARNLSSNTGISGGENIIPAYLSIKNPYKAKNLREVSGDNKSESRKFREKLIAKGYDGIEFDNPFGPFSWYVAFEPTQIKSATGNIGTFDPKNPDIRFQRPSLASVLGTARAQELIQAPTGPRQNQRAKQVAAKAAKFTEGWANAPRIVTFNSGKEALAAYPELASRYSESDMDGVPALFIRNPQTGAQEVVLIASHSYLNDKGGVEKAILHEVIGHYGIREVLKQQAKGDKTKYVAEYNALMTQVFEAKKDDPFLADIVNRYFGKPISELTDMEKAIAGDEYIAHLAQDGVQDKWIDRVIAKLRQILRQLGVTIGLSDAEIRALIGNSMRIVRGPQGRPLLRQGVDQTNGPRAMIIGEQGASQLDQDQEVTTRIDNLAVAREMEEAGQPKGMIRIATGWERGKDGLWRYEIGDGGLKIDFESINAIKPTETVKLGDVLDNPELFKAYPGLKDVNVSFYEQAPNQPEAITRIDLQNIAFRRPNSELELSQGRIDPSFTRDALSGKRVDQASRNPDTAFNSSLLHEIQHFIQSLEGFATGGNGQAVWNRLVDNQVQEYAQDSKKPIDQEQQRELAEQDIRAIYKDPQTAYERLAGEVESRNVQRRARLTPQERRMKTLEYTEDIAREDQIILQGLDGAQFSATDQTQTPEFKAWFGDSKVVDENGKPLTVYHGTASDFDTFQPRSKAPDTLFEKDFENDVYFFSNSPETAYEYAGDGLAAENIMPAFLSIQNPYVIDRGGRGYRTALMSGWIKQAKDSGHDGMIVKNMRDLDQKEGGTQYVAFSPTQIKSATGNVGTFDGNNPDIRFLKVGSGNADFSAVNSRNYTEAKLSWWERNVIERFQDRLIRGKKLIQRKTGGQVSDKADFYTKENLASSKGLEKTRKFTKDLWNPLIQTAQEIVKANKDLTSEDISNYLKAKHHAERKAYFIDKFTQEGKKIPKDDRWPTGMTDEEANQRITDFESKVKSETRKKLHDQVRKINRFTTVERYKAGMITKDVYKDLLTRYEHYVPLTDWSGMESSNERVYSLLMSAKGRTSEAGDPIPFMATAAQEAIMRGENNRVKQAFLEFAKENVSPGEYFIRKAYYVNTKMQDEFGNDIWMETMTKPTDAQFASGEAMRSFNPDVHRHVQQQGDTPGVLPVMVEGKKVFIEFKDVNYKDDKETKKGLMSTIKNINQDQVPAGLAWLRNYTRWLSSMYTQYSPEFGIRNLIRDLGFGTFNMAVDGDFRTAAQTMRKMGKSTVTLTKFFKNDEFPAGKDGNYLKEFMAEGAMTGYTDLKTAGEIFEQVRKEINQADKVNLWAKGGKAVAWPIMKFGEGLEIYNKTLENAMRFSYYKTLREQGISKQQAAAKAKDLTVNFNRKGRHSAFMGSLFIFFNASVQGTERLIRSFSNPKTRKKAWGFAGTIMAAGFMQSALHGLFDDEDEDGKTFYEKIPDYVRRNNIIIPTGDGDFVKIPLPYGLNIFYAAGESLGRVVTGKSNAATEAVGMLSAASNVFSPLGGMEFGADDSNGFYDALSVMTPSIIQPGLDLGFNRNFAGRPIYRENFASNQYNLPDSEMYFEGVNPYIREATTFLNNLTGGDEVIAGKVDINPEWIEYGIEQYFGGPVQFGKNLVTTGLNMYDLGILKTLDDPYLRSVPFARSFAQKTGTDFEARSNYYENRDAAVAAKEAYEIYLENGKTERAEEFFRENEKLINLAEEYKWYEKNIRTLNQTIGELKKADKEAFDADIEDLYTQKTQLMREFNKQFGEQIYQPRPNPLKEILGIK